MPHSIQQSTATTRNSFQLSSEPVAPPQPEYLRQRKVLTLVPFSRTTLWRRIKDRSFPQPFKISKGITVWRAEEIRAWIDHQKT